MPKYRYRKLRRPKRRLYIRKGFWFLFLFSIIISSFVYVFFFSDFLKVKNIEVSGNQKLGADDVKQALIQEVSEKILFFIPKNIFSLDFKKLSAEISQKFPEIERISIKRNLPNTVYAEIIEKVPAGCWCFEQCYYFDQYGVIFQENVGCDNLLVIKSDKIPEISKQIISETEAKDFTNIYKEINPIAEIKDISVFDETKIVLQSKLGWKAYLRFDEDIQNQIINLKAVLEQKVSEDKRSQLDYIDVRFGNKVFYKFKNLEKNSLL